MKKLISGIADFRMNLTEERRALFEKLALGQKPDTLFICCSDSRVAPNLFASTNPGDLFVLRNVGNLIPPSSLVSLDSSAAAAIEFALFSLNVSDIVVCGHSECGAMLALANGVEEECCSHLKTWLTYGAAALKKVLDGFVLDKSLSLHNRISQANVLQQIEHLLSYPFVQERLEKKKLRIHGWWFDIAKVSVYCYEPDLMEYILIDEKEAKLILERLS